MPMGCSYEQQIQLNLSALCSYMHCDFAAPPDGSILDLEQICFFWDFLHLYNFKYLTWGVLCTEM